MSASHGSNVCPGPQIEGEPVAGQTLPPPSQPQLHVHRADLGEGTPKGAIGPQHELLLLPEPDRLLELEEEPLELEEKLLDDDEPLDMPAPPRESR